MTDETGAETMDNWLAATVLEGHGIASGRSRDTPYGAGSISLQRPHFEALGLDLSDCFEGTINLSIAPLHFEIIAPDHCFRQVTWCKDGPVEDFSFVRCTLALDLAQVNAWVYYPHPDTKPGHFHPDSLVEVISPYLAGLQYGSSLQLGLPADRIRVFE